MNQNSNQKTKDTFYISEGKSCSLSLHVIQLIIWQKRSFQDVPCTLLGRQIIFDHKIKIST